MLVHRNFRMDDRTEELADALVEGLEKELPEWLSEDDDDSRVLVRLSDDGDHVEVSVGDRRFALQLMEVL